MNEWMWGGGGGEEKRELNCITYSYYLCSRTASLIMLREYVPLLKKKRFLGFLLLPQFVVNVNLVRTIVRSRVGMGHRERFKKQHILDVSTKIAIQEASAGGKENNPQLLWLMNRLIWLYNRLYDTWYDTVSNQLETTRLTKHRTKWPTCTATATITTAITTAILILVTKDHYRTCVYVIMWKSMSIDGMRLKTTYYHVNQMKSRRGIYILYFDTILCLYLNQCPDLMLPVEVLVEALISIWRQ